MKNIKPRSKLVLEELSGKRIPYSLSENISELIIEKPLEDPRSKEPRRSGRVARQLNRYMSYEDALTAVYQNDDEPISYADVMAGPEANLWQEAMNSEIYSIYLNEVWKLVDMPEGIKPVGGKQIYKKKKGLDENIETFKEVVIVISYFLLFSTKIRIQFYQQRGEEIDSSFHSNGFKNERKNNCLLPVFRLKYR